MPKFDDLSVLIVTWNGDDMLKNCLDSICRVYAESLEIVVVDNANLESTKKLVSGFNNAKYIPSETNLGFAGGNNLGLPLCTRKYVLLLNNDTLIHEDSFGPLMEYMKEHPKVAVTQGRMRLSKVGNVLDMCGVMLTPSGVLYDAYMMLDDSVEVPTRPVHSIKGAMMMIRKDVVVTTGALFYDHFHCNYEETDFCHRVWLCGYEVHYVDTPAIDHLQNQTIARLDQVDVHGKSIANQLFSIMTTLEAWNACRMTMHQLVLHFSMALYNLCKGHVEAWRIFCRALKYVWMCRKEIRNTRIAVQKKRKVSDKELFAKIMLRPGWLFYYHILRGDWVDYKKSKY